MPLEEFTERAKEFIEANRELKLETPEGIKIHIFEDEGWLRVMLEAEAEMGHDPTRNAVSLLLLWRDRLLDFQGTRDHETWLKEWLSKRNYEGESYAQIAESFNRKVAETLMGEVRTIGYWLVEGQRKYSGIGEMFWYETALTRPEQVEFEHQTLIRLGIKEREIEVAFQEGRRNILNAEAAFATDYPVSGDRIRNLLKDWRMTKKHIRHTEKGVPVQIMAFDDDEQGKLVSGWKSLETVKRPANRTRRKKKN